jgi:hypothetical protein
MKSILKKLLFGFLVLLFGAGMGAAGWWFGFRDGFSLAYSETGARLCGYYYEDRSNDPVATKRFLDLYTTEVAAHLLNVDHRFPSYLQPSRAQIVLKQLRATWQPDEKLFRAASDTITQFPGESRRKDYWTAWHQVEPRWTLRNPPKAKSPEQTAAK